MAGRHYLNQRFSVIPSVSPTISTIRRSASCTTSAGPQLGRGLDGGGRGGWVRAHTYAATARTSSSGMFDQPRIGIGLPVQV
jgi:hypothetical protein